MHRWWVTLSLAALAVIAGGDTSAQVSPAAGAVAAGDAFASPPDIETPAGFVIGPDDVLSIVYWRDEEMSTQVTVRPDGKITLPLIDEVQAAGLTPAALRTRLIDESKRFFGNPNITVVVTEIHSRKVFITGQVFKPGPYAITTPTTVLQLISMAGGLKDFADGSNILIVRHEDGQASSYRFNYKDLRRNLRQNIELKPGDTVLVP